MVEYAHVNGVWKCKAPVNRVCTSMQNVHMKGVCTCEWSMHLWMGWCGQSAHLSTGCTPVHQFKASVNWVHTCNPDAHLWKKYTAVSRDANTRTGQARSIVPVNSTSHLWMLVNMTLQNVNVTCDWDLDLNMSVTNTPTKEQDSHLWTGPPSVNGDSTCERILAEWTGYPCVNRYEQWLYI